MLTALGHSPDILGKTEKPGEGRRQGSLEPKQKPLSPSAFTVDQLSGSTLESQGPHDKTRRQEKYVMWQLWTWQPVQQLLIPVLQTQRAAGHTPSIQPQPPLLPHAVHGQHACSPRKEAHAKTSSPALAKVTFSTSHSFPKNRDDEFFSELPPVVESVFGRETSLLLGCQPL